MERTIRGLRCISVLCVFCNCNTAKSDSSRYVCLGKPPYKELGKILRSEILAYWTRLACLQPGSQYTLQVLSSTGGRILKMLICFNVDYLARRDLRFQLVHGKKWWLDQRQKTFQELVSENKIQGQASMKAKKGKELKNIPNQSVEILLTCALLPLPSTAGNTPFILLSERASHEFCILRLPRA